MNSVYIITYGCMDKIKLRRVSTQKFFDILSDEKVTRRSGIVFERYRGAYMVQSLIQLNYNDIQDILEGICIMYKNIGFMGATNMQYLCIDDSNEKLLRNYVGQLSSYGNDYEFAIKLGNKILNIMVFILIDKIIELFGAINTDLIKSDIVIAMIKERSLKTKILSLCKQIAKTRQVEEGEEGVKNMGDRDNDWIGKEYHINGKKVTSRREFLKLKNSDLEDLFMKILSEHGTRFKQHSIMYKEAMRLRDEKEIQPILLRHILLWLLKSMIFGDKRHRSGEILKNYDFYWKHQQFLEPLFDFYYKEIGIKK